MDKIANDEFSALLEKHGAFFAFSKKQYGEKALPDVEYVRMLSGMIAPKCNANQLLAEMEQSRQSYIKRRLSENTIEQIIQYELGNHEAQYNFDIEEILGVTEEYGATEKMIQEQYSIFYQRCIDQDLF